MNKGVTKEKELSPTFWEGLWNFQVLNVLKALLCSFQNILIYIILIILIVKFDQGSILLVDMYTESKIGSLGLNIGLFHFLTYFLALIMTLYPTYIYTSLFVMDSDSKEDENIKWKMEKFGIITYEDDELIDSNKLASKDNNPYFNKDVDFDTLEYLEGGVRKFLGVFLFIIWSGLLGYSYQKYQVDANDTWQFYLSFGLLVSLFIYLYWLITVRLKRKLIKGDNYEKTFENVKYIYKYHVPFFLCLIVAFIISLSYFQWTFFTILFQIIICFFLAIYLTIYRNTRRLINDRSNIVDFIISIRYLGFIALALILGLNASRDFAEMINPINVVLAGLIMLYTIMTMVIKLFLYYRSYPNDKENPPWISKIAFYSLAFILSGFFIYNLNAGNNLHELHLKPETDEVKLSQFYKKYKSIDTTNVDRTPILYAAYGGGLTAHYWNYLILDHLDQDTSQVFNDILAMSGVSGGGMGICNYAAMEYANMNANSKNVAMNKVRNTNILSMELSYLFGLDLLREMLPSWLYWGENRSYRSMTFYNDNLDTKNDLVKNLTFDEVYKTLFDKGYYPNIIVNSTASVNRSGVVSAIRTDTTFPGTINLLDIGYKDQDMTLTFFEAASTCNRFPAISPAANIPNKGHFVDGGYYENSGVLSLISFKQQLDAFEKIEKAKEKKIEIKSIFKNNPKLVSVRNGKSNYIESLIKRVLKKDSTLNLNLVCNDDHTETGAMVKSIFNLERTPTYLRDVLDTYLEDKYDLLFIDLPFYIDTTELDDYFCGTLNSKALGALKTEINDSNNEIKRVLRGLGRNVYDIDNLGVVNPATARLLSKPVEIYMEAMMGHDYVEEQLSKVLK